MSKQSTMKTESKISQMKVLLNTHFIQKFFTEHPMRSPHEIHESEETDTIKEDEYFSEGRKYTIQLVALLDIPMDLKIKYAKLLRDELYNIFTEEIERRWDIEREARKAKLDEDLLFIDKEYDAIRACKQLERWIDAPDVKVKVERVEPRPPKIVKNSRGLPKDNKAECKAWDALYAKTHEHNGQPKK